MEQDKQDTLSLVPRDFTHQRNEDIREGIKGLLLINGGGATAMLAFLQATWSTRPQISCYVAVCIGCMGVGLAFAALVPFFRYHASFAVQENRREDFKRHRRLYLAAFVVSLSMFLVGVFFVVYGFLRQDHPPAETLVTVEISRPTGAAVYWKC